MTNKELVAELQKFDECEVYVDLSQNDSGAIKGVEAIMILPDMEVNEETFNSEVKPKNPNMEFKQHAVRLF